MPTTASATHWFTPEEANKTLPLVRAIVSDIQELRESVRSRQTHVDRMLDARGDGTSPYQDELEAMRRSLREDNRQIDRFIGELTAIGVLVVEGDRPAVEFPAWQSTRAVRLCWNLGDSEIVSWRELNDPENRRRKVADVKFGHGPDPELLSEIG